MGLWFEAWALSPVGRQVKQVACSREPVLGKGASLWTGKTNGEPRGAEGPGGLITGLALKEAHFLSSGQLGVWLPDPPLSCCG